MFISRVIAGIFLAVPVVASTLVLNTPGNEECKKESKDKATPDGQEKPAEDNCGGGGAGVVTDTLNQQVVIGMGAAEIQRQQPFLSPPPPAPAPVLS